MYHIKYSYYWILKLGGCKRTLGVFFSGSVVMNPPAMQETWVWSLGWEDTYAAGGHDNWLQYSYLEKSMERGAWWVKVHRAAMHWTWLKRLRMHACSKNTEKNQFICVSCQKIPKVRTSHSIHQKRWFLTQTWKALLCVA